MQNLFEYIDNLFTNGVINGIISIVVTLILAKLISNFLNKRIEKQDKTRIPLFNSLKKFTIILFVVAIISMQFKATQNLSRTILASSGILAVIVGLASQEAGANLINGMMVMLYHPYKIGDFISVKEYNIKGKVIDVAVRHTIIETLEKTQLIIPNTIMNKAIIENITDTTGNKLNHFYITIAYDSDVDKAKELIKKAVKEHNLFFDSRTKAEIMNGNEAIPVYCTQLLDSSIELRADITTRDNIDGFTLMSDLRQQLLKDFKENNIEIPYPQVVIHNKENKA